MYNSVWSRYIHITCTCIYMYIHVYTCIYIIMFSCCCAIVAAIKCCKCGVGPIYVSITTATCIYTYMYSRQSHILHMTTHYEVIIMMKIL